MIIEPDGTIRFVYDDAIADMLREDMGVEEMTIARASHVEPGADGFWYADMSPVGGVVLGPFAHRAQALVREVAWLNEHNIPAPR